MLNTGYYKFRQMKYITNIIFMALGKSKALSTVWLMFNQISNLMKAFRDKKRGFFVPVIEKFSHFPTIVKTIRVLQCSCQPFHYLFIFQGSPDALKLNLMPGSYCPNCCQCKQQHRCSASNGRLCLCLKIIHHLFLPFYLLAVTSSMGANWRLPESTKRERLSDFIGAHWSFHLTYLNSSSS